MKKILLPILASTFLFAACNTKKTDTLDTENRIVFTDTSAANNANASTDVGVKDTAPIVIADKTVPQKVQIRTVTKVVKVYEKQPTRKIVQKESPQTDSDPIPSSTTTGSTTGAGIPGSGNTGAGTTPVPEKKKNTGWSEAAKTATIGGVGGAVIGGVIGKGGKGAVIGGVIGAAGGYILGRKKDRKSGRVDTTKN